MRRFADSKRIAVVGAGVSGLVAAAELHRAGHDVHVFEAAATRAATPTRSTSRRRPAPLAVDTGFIVFNELNYPNFERMLAELGVASQPADMSFSVSDGRGGFEWATTGPRGLFAQPAHALDPRFHRMLRDLVRFNREARKLVGSGGEARRSAASSPTAATRSTSSSGCSSRRPRRSGPPTPRRCGAFPPASSPSSSTTTASFSSRDRPAWRSITGGSRRYVEALIAPFRDRVHLRTPVRRIHRRAGAAWWSRSTTRASASTRS